MKKIINEIIGWLLVVILPLVLTLLVMVALGQINRGNIDIVKSLLLVGAIIGIIIATLWIAQLGFIGPIVKIKREKHKNENN